MELAQAIVGRRQAYVEALGKSPGASTREVARAVGVTEGTADHHLRKLVKAGVVVRKRYGRTVAHWLNGGMNWRDRHLSLLSRTARVVFGELAAAGRPMRAHELALRVGQPLGEVRWALDRLVVLSLAAKPRSGWYEVIEE